MSTTRDFIAVGKEWTLLCEGPGFVQLQSNDVLLLAADTALPEADDRSALRVTPEDPNFEWGGRDNLYGRAVRGMATVVVWTQ